MREPGYRYKKAEPKQGYLQSYDDYFELVSGLSSGRSWGESPIRTAISSRRLWRPWPASA